MTKNTTTFKEIANLDTFGVGDIINVCFGDTSDGSQLFMVTKFDYQKVGLLVLHGYSLGTMWTWGGDPQYFMKPNKEDRVTKKQIENYVGGNITIKRVVQYEVLLDYAEG